MKANKLIATTFLLLVLFCLKLNSQIAPDTYWVSFTDKANSAFSVERPNEFLSQRAIDRRKRQSINIGQDDLPVNQTYIDSLQHLGLKIHNVSKWFNGVAVVSTDQALIDTLHYISFIKNPVSSLAQTQQKNASEIDKFKEVLSSEEDYSSSQLEMIFLDKIHQQGYKGEGMLIGILDAGFKSAQNIESLNHIWERNKVLAVRDFVKDTNDIFNSHSHGTLVFSIIAANWPDNLTGSAPDADYILVRTEDAKSEYLIEEYNWVSGAEFADSLGVDIINSSLGYSEFEDPSQNHSYEDLDGKTIPISKAATIAARKGILVVNSAGNSGNDPWYYITAPGDADSILTIGAVNANKDIANFSSRGPTSDGRIKPDVCAMGQGTAGQIAIGSVYHCSGTSCSAPVITGLAASLWAEHPYANVQQIRQAIIESSHLYFTPNNDYGFGVPNALIADSNLRTIGDSIGELTKIHLFPNPTKDEVIVQLYLPWLEKPREGSVSLRDLNGRLINFKTSSFNPGLNIFDVEETKELDAGYYFIQVNVYGRFYSFPLVKLD